MIASGAYDASDVLDAAVDGLAHKIDPLSVTTLHPARGAAEVINHLP